ncbi:phosphoribosylformylglycinamidine synthase [Lagopus leucura]|uniref:phosphoribosylformylglycinamidine synthase n=1 Tax=Lagopus leucura TaxID=30410 RepID=UPI001C67394A|nr:phosphoribosylformylglycinamidine synthase [Lagopus leucura]
MGPSAEVSVSVGGTVVLQDSVGSLRALWERTSFQLERLQTTPRCAEMEEEELSRRQGAQFCLSFQPIARLPRPVGAVGPRVAVLREEGSNGDREMAAAFHMAACEVMAGGTEIPEKSYEIPLRSQRNPIEIPLRSQRNPMRSH